MKKTLALALATTLLAATPALANDHDKDTNTSGNYSDHQRDNTTHGDSETGATDTRNMQTGTAASTGAAASQSSGSTHMGAGRNSGGDTSTDHR